MFKNASFLDPYFFAYVLTVTSNLKISEESHSSRTENFVRKEKLIRLGQEAQCTFLRKSVCVRFVLLGNSKMPLRDVSRPVRKKLFFEKVWPERGPKSAGLKNWSWDNSDSWETRPGKKKLETGQSRPSLYLMLGLIDNEHLTKVRQFIITTKLRWNE